MNSKTKKVLYVATVDSHIISFHIPYLKMLKNEGYEVHVCTGEDGKIPYCDKKHTIAIKRSPYRLGNIKAIGELKKIINENDYKLIHCHTPMGGVVTRLAAKKARKKGTKVFYTAHGFHFFKGAPLLNWLIYYPIEKWLSKYTDTLITINEEDYKRAKKKFKKCNRIELVNGVGINIEKFSDDLHDKEKEQLKKKLNLKKDDFVILQVGELNKNKNQILAIKVMKELTKTNKKIKLLLAGKGKLEQFYKDKIKEYNLQNNVYVLGYRQDVPKLMKVSNVLLSLSYREGLPVNVIEAMASGLPIIATNCRGNRDLVVNEKNGYIINNNDVKKLKEKIIFLQKNEATNSYFKTQTQRLVENYALDKIEERFKEIYEWIKENK